MAEEDKAFYRGKGKPREDKRNVKTIDNRAI
jgi:hypothetical protein